MADDRTKPYCDQHFEIAKHWGSMERAVVDMDGKINKLFDLVEGLAEKDNEHDKELVTFSEYIKNHAVSIGQFIALASIAAKLWIK